MIKFGRWLLSVALLLVPFLSAKGAVAAPLYAQTAAAPARPAGLPNHFGFGIEAGQGDTWMPESHINWDYRWQYLAGGVNTGQGWETWGPNGTFALNYANESNGRGLIPMFPYYELFQSRGTCDNCPENQKNLTNLNTPATMRAYFDNFALLMKRLGPGTYDGIQGYGKVALVNLEPDFSGGYTVQAVNNGACFGFCDGRGNDPSQLRAAVARSGHPDVAGFPDNYAGFTRALAHLRDLYAPNVLLGYDVSTWATGVDIGSDNHPATDVGALGQQVGSFVGQLGPHELLFNNPLDRDAGQYRARFGQNRWWDRLNVGLPNFTRWEQYLQRAGAADGSKPMLLWQVPVGNQYFQSENNTDGHYQDNRVEYIFGHVPELIEAGVIGALLGPGNGGNTTWGDVKQDGVTNPAPICVTDGVSSGQICNDHPSQVSDDDGGYIRMMGQAYYANPVALARPAGVAQAPPPPTLVPAPAAPPTLDRPPLRVELAPTTIDPSVAAAGNTVTVHQDIAVNTEVNVLVDYELWDASGQKVWQQWHDNLPATPGNVLSDSAALTVGSDLAPGQYRLVTGVFSAGWGTQYAWNAQAGTLGVVEP